MIVEEKPAGIWTFIALTWRSVLHAVRRAPLVFAGSFVAMALIGVGSGFLDREIGKIPSSSWVLRQAGGAAEFAAALLQIALISLALAPVAMAVHRLVILDDRAMAHTGRYAAWLFGFLLFWKAVQLPALMFGDGSFALEWLATGIAAIVVLRSALLFPVLAIDTTANTIKDRVEESWRIAIGHLRRLFVVWVGAALPLIIVAIILSRRSAAAAETTATIKPALAIVPAIVRAAVIVLATAVSAAAASWVYLWALGHPKEPSKP